MVNDSTMNLSLADRAYFQIPITNMNNKFWFAKNDVCVICNLTISFPVETISWKFKTYCTKTSKIQNLIHHKIQNLKFPSSKN